MLNLSALGVSGMLRSCWLVVLLVAGGCFSPQFDDRSLTCGPDNLCPPGFECLEGKCTSTGTHGDGGGIDGDQVAPAAPQLMSIAPTSPANNNAPRIIGSAEPLATITLFADAACGG